MICEKCGYINADDVKYCEDCGAELHTEEIEIADETIEEIEISEGTDCADENESDEAVEIADEEIPDEMALETPDAPVRRFEPFQKFFLVSIGVYAAIILIIAVVVSGVFKSASLKAVEKSLNASINGDGEAAFELTMHPFALENAIEDKKYKSKEDAIEDFKESAENIRENLEEIFGKDVSASVEHYSTIKYTKSDVEKINEYLAEKYDYPQNYISALHVVKVKTLIEGREDIDYQTDEIVVAKVQGKWYVGSINGIYSSKDIEKILK